jgi:hypothetical protein
MDKAARVASIMEGREGREKFGARKKKSSTASTTNREKQKSTKNAVMVEYSLLSFCVCQIFLASFSDHVFFRFNTASVCVARRSVPPARSR